MKRFLATLTLVLTLLPAAARRGDRTVIVVSMDGFRADYVRIHGAPNIEAVMKNGVSTAMWPSYPASTFPNHYAIATGLVPDRNGIVNNAFYDPDYREYYSMSGTNRSNPAFFLGEPIWVTAMRQGLKAGIVYWVGSDFLLRGQHPTYYKDYSQPPLLEYEARVDTVLSYLEMPEVKRPRLIMLYFDEPDHNGHVYGPTSPETGEAVRRVDEMVGRLREGIARSSRAREVDLILLADHGMTEVSKTRMVNVFDYIRREWLEHIITGTPTSLFTRPEYRDSVYRALQKASHVQVWKKEDIPAYLDYGTSNRIGDIIVAPDMGWQIGETAPERHGAHGYDPYESDMFALFCAEGPDFRRNKTIPQFRNVSIYPLMCYLLGIRPAPNDGDLNELKKALR